MQIAILGIRGVPARYGGFETFAEELGFRLVARGHRVTVYARQQWTPRGVLSYRGMRVVRLPAPHSKYLETVVHTLVSAVHAMRRNYDVVYICNSANVPSAILLRAIGRRVVLNVDGLEWKRKKWNLVGRAYYRACTRLAAAVPVELVTDARVIQQFYLDTFGRETRYFPYGTDIGRDPDDGTLDSLGLRSEKYILYVSRLEPENNALEVVEAYRNVATELPLVVVGDAPYAGDYIGRVRARADPRVRFAGAIYGSGYRALLSHATAYIQATEVGGTHPALVEAMGRGLAILANDVPEHREVLGPAGVYYRGPDELAAKLGDLLAEPARAAEFGSRARERARSLFSWDSVTDQYELWLSKLVE